METPNNWAMLYPLDIKWVRKHALFSFLWLQATRQEAGHIYKALMVVQFSVYYNGFQIIKQFSQQCQYAVRDEEDHWNGMDSESVHDFLLVAVGIYHSEKS